MKCREHPKYKAIRKPLKTKKHPKGCECCYALWLYKKFMKENK